MMIGLLKRKEKMMMENLEMLHSPEQMMKHCSPDQMMDCLEMLQSPDKMKKYREMLQSEEMLALRQAESLRYEQTVSRIKFWESIWKERSAWEQRLLNCLVGNIYWRARLHHIDQALLLQSPKTKVDYRNRPGYPPNRVIDIITQASTVVIIVAWDALKEAKALTKRKTHEGKKRGAGRRGSISGGPYGDIIKGLRDSIRMSSLLKIKIGQTGFYVSQVIDPALHSKSWSGGERAKGGARRDGSIGKDRDGEAIPNINWDRDPALHIKSWGGGERERGGAGRDKSIGRDRDGEAIPNIDRDRDPALYSKSWGRMERAKGGAGRDESIGRDRDRDRDREAIPNIDRDCESALHSKRPDISQVNGRAERRDESSNGLKGESGNKSTCRGRDQERSGSCGSECRDREGEGSGSGESQEGCRFGSECGEVKGEGSRSVESECQDAEGEESRSGASQGQDGEGEGSLSGESQGRDREVGSASGESQGQDRNAEGGGSNDDEDEREHERSVSGDIEHGTQESGREESDSRIPETFMCIIGAITIAAVDFHNNGAISSNILGFLIAINVVGFLCCMTSMLHRHRKPWAARIFGTVGAAAAGLGLLLLGSGPFSSFYRWMILGTGSLAILVISVLAFMS